MTLKILELFVAGGFLSLSQNLLIYFMLKSLLFRERGENCGKSRIRFTSDAKLSGANRKLNIKKKNGYSGRA